MSRQEYWSGLLFPFPGDLPDPGIEPSSPALQADSLLSEPQGKPIGKGKSTPQLAQWSRRNAGHQRARQVVSKSFPYGFILVLELS